MIIFHVFDCSVFQILNKNIELQRSSGTIVSAGKHNMSIMTLFYVY